SSATVWPSSKKLVPFGAGSSRSSSISATSRCRNRSAGWYHSRSQWVWETTWTVSKTLRSAWTTSLVGRWRRREYGAQKEKGREHSLAASNLDPITRWADDP